MTRGPPVATLGRPPAALRPAPPAPQRRCAARLPTGRCADRSPAAPGHRRSPHGDWARPLAGPGPSGRAGDRRPRGGRPPRPRRREQAEEGPRANAASSSSAAPPRTAAKPPPPRACAGRADPVPRQRAGGQAQHRHDDELAGPGRPACRPGGGTSGRWPARPGWPGPWAGRGRPRRRRPPGSAARSRPGTPRRPPPSPPRKTTKAGSPGCRRPDRTGPVTTDGQEVAGVEPRALGDGRAHLVGQRPARAGPA